MCCCHTSQAKLCVRSVLNSAVGMNALLDHACFTDLLAECLSSTFDGLRYQVWRGLLKRTKQTNT